MQFIPRQPSRVIAGLAFGLSLAFSGAASATLTSETVNGQNLVYDSGNNTTWTQDANLLGTLENTQGFSTIVNAIIGADPVIHDTPNYWDGSYSNYDGRNGRPFSGIYSLSANDFGSGGTVDWWAAQAFVHYLDTEKYGGSSQWALPTTPDTISSIGYNQISAQLGELYYNELNALAYPGTNGSDYGILHDGSNGTSGNAGPFVNAHTYGYWSGTEDSSSSYTNVWVYDTHNGYQEVGTKVVQYYAWAVTPGNVAASAVPVPAAIWLFGSALAGLIGFNHRKLR